MPARRIVKDEEYLKIAVDPEAAKARLNELRKERHKLENLKSEDLVKLKEELDLRAHELNARERQAWEKNDAFFKELETRRHKLEKREQEVEDLFLKAANRQREAEERVAAFSGRESALALDEANLRDARDAFEKERQEFVEQQAREKTARELLVRQLSGLSG